MCESPAIGISPTRYQPEQNLARSRWLCLLFFATKALTDNAKNLTNVYPTTPRLGLDQGSFTCGATAALTIRSISRAAPSAQRLAASVPPGVNP